MKRLSTLLLALVLAMPAMASEADLVVPDSIRQHTALYYGFIVCLLGMLFGFYQYTKVRKLPAHKSMLDIADVIYKTCKAYLAQQGRFLAILFIFIGATVAGYFGFLSPIGETPAEVWGAVGLIILWTVIGILGSYAVAAFGIRMNTLANSRMAFASLKKKASEPVEYSAGCRYEHWCIADLCGINTDVSNLITDARSFGRCLLYWFCHW